MPGSLERGIRDAGQDAPEIWSLLFLPQTTPERRVGGSDKHQNGDDGAHRD
jgi:hypothetical protein